MAVARASKRVTVDWGLATDDYTVPEGRYILRIVDASVGKSQSGDPRVGIEYLVLAPKTHKGRKFRIFYGLTVAPGLRQLRELLTGLGARVPNKAAALDLSKLEGTTLKVLAKVTEGKSGGKFQELHEIERHGSASPSRHKPEPEPKPEPEDDLDDLDDELDESLDNDNDDFDDELDLDL